MNQELTLNELKRNKEYLEKKYGITKIGIFGSIARGMATEKSDVDIVFEIKSPNIFTSVHIKEDLEKIFNCSVDLVRYRKKMNPYLKKRIDAEGIYVWQRAGLFVAYSG